MKKADLILIFIIVTFGLVSLLVVSVIKSLSSSEYLEAKIYYDDTLIREVELYDLSEESTITLYKSDYPKLLDDVVITYKNGAIKVEEEESPRNVCSLQGWVTNTIEPIICLPNFLRIDLISGEPGDLDGDI